MANNNDKNNKNGKNGTESILSRIASRAMKGMRRGANIPENQGILQTLAQRASSPTGQFYATLADPNAYYDKQGFGSAGTGMRTAQQAHQGAQSALAKQRAVGMPTPTAMLNNKRLVWSELMGDEYGGVMIPDPRRPVNEDGSPNLVDFRTLPEPIRISVADHIVKKMGGIDVTNHPIALKMFQTKIKGGRKPKDAGDNWIQDIWKGLKSIPGKIDARIEKDTGKGIIGNMGEYWGNAGRSLLKKF